MQNSLFRMIACQIEVTVFGMVKVYLPAATAKSSIRVIGLLIRNAIWWNISSTKSNHTAGFSRILTKRQKTSWGSSIFFRLHLTEIINVNTS